MFLDPLYLLLFVITLGISLAAQAFVRSTYRKYERVRNSAGLTGLEVGEAIVRRTTLGDQTSVAVEQPGGQRVLRVEGISFAGARGELSVHYDPRSHTVFRSQEVATQPSVAAMAIVAHEIGLAEQ